MLNGQLFRVRNVWMNAMSVKYGKAQASRPKVSTADDQNDGTTLKIRLKEPAPAPVQSYSEWFREHVLKSRWAVWFAAFYFHWIIVILLAVLVVHGPESFARVILNGAVSTEELKDLMPESRLESVVEIELEQPATESVSPTPTDTSAEQQEIQELQIAESVLKSLLPAGDKAGGSDASESDGTPSSTSESALGSGTPTPSHAVTQGSFSVWTEPANPEPGEAYKIIIQIRLPDGTRTYNLLDLEGVVVGSDGYRKPIPGAQRGVLPVSQGSVQFVVHVVSADEHVEDTVFVRSKLLKESQKLIIRF